MRRPRRDRRQLHLYHECPPRTVMLPDDVHGHVVNVLADLLVEALGEDNDARRPNDGGADESEDRTRSASGATKSTESS